MIDLNRIYALEMMRKRRLRNTIREDIAWDILVDAGGATHAISVQCLTGQTANIDWGDGTSTEATATAMTSYVHDYPAGTFEISITGGVSLFTAYPGTDKIIRIRNINVPTLVNIRQAFRNITTICPIDSNAKLSPNVKRAGLLFRFSTGITHIPLSLWPKNGFVSSAISIDGFCDGATNIVGSIAPSHILWDAPGKTFNVSRTTFFPNNSTAWLNHAAAYTDPATGITYTKIPYAWGGAAD